MAKDWIQGAINPKHKGMEKRAAQKAGMSTHAYMEQNKDKPGKAGARARLGLRLSAMNKKKDGGAMEFNSTKTPGGDLKIRGKKSGGSAKNMRDKNDHDADDGYKKGGKVAKKKAGGAIVKKKSGGACRGGGIESRGRKPISAI